MKKILVLVMIAIATVGSAFAENPVKYETLYKLNNDQTFNSMVRYLKADDDQKDQLKYVFLKTEEKMKTALKKDDLNAANKVLNFNLGNAKYILSSEQYKKYVAVLNVSIYTTNDEMMADNNIK